MIRVEGIRLKLPDFVVASQPRVAPMPLEGYGHLEDLVLIDDATLQFTFVAETELGEALAKAMKEGRARMDAQFPRGLLPGMTLRNLSVRLVWETEPPGLIEIAKPGQYPGLF